MSSRRQEQLLLWWLVYGGVLLLHAGFTAADDLSRPADTREFFEQRIQSVLKDHCFECHSDSAGSKGKLEAGLRVDTPEGLRRGGESGPAVVAGKPEQSLLISALRHDAWQMPPKGKLPDQVVTDFVRWIEQGAFDPRPAESPESPVVSAPVPHPSAPHWAFQPLRSAVTALGPNDAWCRDPIDQFVLAKLQQEQLSPAAEASRETLIRRLSFDLIGLPPTPEEVADFLRDERPDAYERLVESLLASPRYGERWGRHWLDLARYADSSGFHNDLDRPTAWRYRDYVIRSWNADKPYGRFVAEQLAGDEIEGANEETLVATGFCRNGPSNDDNMGKDVEKYRLDQLDDVISTTASVFLGLTLGCARCHDHKYDPIPIEDYYRFLAVFNSTERYGDVTHVKDGEKAKQADAAKLPLALVENTTTPRATHVLRRGNHRVPGKLVAAGVPQAIAFRPLVVPAPPQEAKSTGQRLALARWIVDPENPLTYRVLANRVWQHFFGRGIVATASDFGAKGAPPTHPELLDFLAAQLIRDGGHLKGLLRRIVTSATYRQQSSTPAEVASSSAARDPENRWLSRQNLRRLEAEPLRDAVLFVSGNLNLRMNGPGVKPRIRPELITASQRNKWPALKSESPAEWRRGVYVYAKRQLLFPMFELFDAPTTTDSCAARATSTLPTQALILMNDEFFEDQAVAFASRVSDDVGDDLPHQLDRLHRLALGRALSDRERDRVAAFVSSQEREYSAGGNDARTARLQALADVAHVLFNSSEFVFVP